MEGCGEVHTEPHLTVTVIPGSTPPPSHVHPHGFEVWYGLSFDGPALIRSTRRQLPCILWEDSSLHGFMIAFHH